MIFYITIIISLIIDFITKLLAYNYLSDRINIISDFFYFQYFENTGVAFSVDIPFLKVLTIILIIGIFYYYFKEEKNKKDKVIDLSFGLILGGAIGNGIERIFNGKVIDFLGVKYFSIFNMADTFISLGAIIIIIHLLKHNK